MSWRHRRRSILAALALGLPVAATDVRAVNYYVDATGGVDRSQCVSAPGPGAAACRTISYVINNRVLTGGDVVNIAPGDYRESVTVTTADAGTGPTSRVVFRGAGKNSTFISGLAAPAGNVPDGAAQQCTAALNCAGDGLAYPNVYRIDIGTRTIRTGQVWETVWYDDKVRASDDTTEASYHFDQPVSYSQVGSVAVANNVAGSYYYASPYLYVRTWDTVAPSVGSTDIETGNLQTIVYVNGADFVTFRDMTIRYADRLVHVNGDADSFELLDVNLFSARDYGLLFYGTADNARLDHVDIQSAQERHGMTSAGKNDYWGLGSNSAGQCASIANSGTTVRGHRWSWVNMRSCWNGFSLENVQDSTFEYMFMEGSTNHVFRMLPGGADTCAGVVVRNSIALNGQDAWYNAGCPNARFIRNVIGDVSITNQGAAPSGLRWYSNVFGENCTGAGAACDSWTLNVPADGTPGFAADHNWYPTWAMRCSWSGTNYTCRDDGQGTDWPDACNCDRNQRSGDFIQFANVRWSVAKGLAQDELVWSDFYPTAASTAVIDRGSPDLDGDGVLENGPGGDDECTVANHCYGAGPDIGPFEYGIDVPDAGGGGSQVAAPTNVRRTDTR